jgi:hypothetical protein
MFGDILIKVKVSSFIVTQITLAYCEGRRVVGEALGGRAVLLNSKM